MNMCDPGMIKNVTRKFSYIYFKKRKTAFSAQKLAKNKPVETQ